MRSYIYVLLCIYFALTNQFVHGQTENITYRDHPYTDSTILLITNRLCNTEQNTTCTFSNFIDLNNPVKIFKFGFSESNCRCNLIEDVYELNSILDSDKDLLFFVHGDGKTVEGAALRALEIQKIHNINVIVFSWPSKIDKVNGLKNFKNSVDNVEFGLSKFKELILLVQELRQLQETLGGKNKISLFLHSLGNYYIELAAKYGLLNDINDYIIDNLIINAAAINRVGHDEWLDQLNFQKNIYIINNNRDFNLRGVQVFTKAKKQLGKRLKLPLSENAKYINFSKAIGFKFPTHITHTYFMGKITNDSENIKLFYSKLFHGEEMNLDDTSLFIKRKDGLGYNILF